MKYFCKVSWQCDEQPLQRKHENVVEDIPDKIFLRKSVIGHTVSDYVQNRMGGIKWRFNFTIDFMMPIPGEKGD